jgi:hypothetical protein
MNKLLTLLAVSGAATLLTASAAMAQSYPTNVVGTWTIRANNTLPFTFSVQSQSSDSPCALITGLIGAPNDTISGYYCPATGGVSFLRNSANTGATYQIFTGQVSLAGSQNQMTGTFANFAGGDNTGAFSFSASIPGS